MLAHVTTPPPDGARQKPSLCARKREATYAALAGARQKAGGLRVRKREATYAALAGAAFALARKHGLGGFTVDDVARRADVSRRTFFNYFVAKEEAVTAVIRLQTANLFDQIEEQVAAGRDTPRDPGQDREAVMSIVDTTVRTLLSEESVSMFRALKDLAETSPELVPHIAGIERDTSDRFARLMPATASGSPDPAHAVHAFAIPGAVVAIVVATYMRRLRVREVDGDGPGALGIDDVVAQLQDLIPVRSVPGAGIPQPGDRNPSGPSS